MSSRIDHIIQPRHNIQVAVFVEVPGVPCRVVPWSLGQVFLDEGFVVVVKSQHEAGRHWQFYAYFAQGFYWLRFVVVVEDLHFEAWGWFGGATGFWFEGVEIHVVARDNPPCFSLPIVIVYQYFQVVLDPFVSGNVAPLSSHRHPSQR
jgi:hypothetical protein